MKDKELFRAGVIYFNLKNYLEAVKYLSPLVKKEHSYAQYYLGQIYEYGGHGIKQSISRAKKLYISSAINNCERAIKAMIRIGNKELSLKK